MGAAISMIAADGRPRLTRRAIDAAASAAGDGLETASALHCCKFLSSWPRRRLLRLSDD
jgi:hypothetical protein